MMQRCFLALIVLMPHAWSISLSQVPIYTEEDVPYGIFPVSKLSETAARFSKARSSGAGIVIGGAFADQQSDGIVDMTSVGSLVLLESPSSSASISRPRSELYQQEQQRVRGAAALSSPRPRDAAADGKTSQPQSKPANGQQLTRKHQSSFLAQAQAAAGNFTCQTLPVEYSPFITCSGVVDYSFYVPFNVTLDDLDIDAKAEAAYANSFLSQSCLSDIKRMICARIYKPCVTGVVPGDTSTYALVDSTYRLPYHRPCESLCIAASYLGTTCRGMFEAFGGDANCLAADPIQPSLSLFDSSDNSSLCNALPSVQGQEIVANAYEPYIGKICQGIATTYYVPTSSSISPLLAPLLPPYVIQSIVEATVTAIEDVIPMYLQSSCLQAQRKIMCALEFMPASPSDLLDAFFGTVYLPSMPYRDVCTTYVSECAYLIGLVPALSFNCSQVVGSSMNMFPTETQTIVTVNLGYGAVELQSPPNTLQNATCTLSTECPYGFAVPANLNYPGTTSITGTGCASLCPVPTSTADEYLQVYHTALSANLFAMSMTLLSFFNVYVTSPKKRNIYVMLILANLFLPAIVGTGILLSVDPNRGYDNVCSSPTSMYTVETSKHSIMGRACMVQAIVGVFILFFESWALFACFCELWVRVVLAAKDVTFYRYFYFWGVLVISLMMFLVSIFYGEPQPVGGGGSLLTCSWGVSDSKLNFKLQTVPQLIFFVVELVISFHVIYQCVKVSMQVQQKGTNPLANIWKSYRTLFLLNIGNIITFSILLIYFGILFTYVYVPHIVNSTVSWMSCLFVNFTNDSDTSYIAKCGGYVPPGRRYEGAEKNLAYGLQFVPPLFSWFVTLGADAKTVWRGVLNKFSVRSSRVLASSRLSSSSSSSSQHIAADKGEKGGSEKPLIKGTDGDAKRGLTVRESDNSHSNNIAAGGGSFSVHVKVAEKYITSVPDPYPTERLDDGRPLSSSLPLSFPLPAGAPPARPAAAAGAAAGGGRNDENTVQLFRTESACDLDHLEEGGGGGGGGAHVQQKQQQQQQQQQGGDKMMIFSVGSSPFHGGDDAA